MAEQPLLCQGHIIGASRSHLDTPHSVGLSYTSDLFVGGTSTWQHTTLTRDIHASSEIWTFNSSKRAAADARFRPRSHWDGPKIYQSCLINSLIAQNGLMNSTKLNKDKVSPCYLRTEVHISCVN